MIKPGLEAVRADPRYWRFLPGRATDTRLDAAGIERVFRVCSGHEYGLIAIDTLEDLQPDSANLNDGASARRMSRPHMLRCQETGVAALMLRHEGKAIRRRGVRVGAGSIKLIAALRATFLLMQNEDEEPVRIAPRLPCSQNRDERCAAKTVARPHCAINVRYA